MRNAILIFPLVAFEWEKGKKTLTIGWLKTTYSFTW
tara:strand:- start:285 stop:392 length:108 start_codon:yes stop_codon:yes gene_type:complete